MQAWSPHVAKQLWCGLKTSNRSNTAAREYINEEIPPSSEKLLNHHQHTLVLQLFWGKSLERGSRIWRGTFYFLKFFKWMPIIFRKSSKHAQNVRWKKSHPLHVYAILNVEEHNISYPSFRQVIVMSVASVSPCLILTPRQRRSWFLRSQNSKKAFKLQQHPHHVVSDTNDMRHATTLLPSHELSRERRFS